MVVVSAAWPLAVSLWPGSAPYIGGSTDGSAEWLKPWTWVSAARFRRIGEGF